MPIRALLERAPRLRSMFLQLLVFDVLMGAAITIAYDQALAYDKRLALLFALVHLAAWSSFLRIRLDPIRGWQREADDEGLIAADAVLQTLSAQFARVYGASWLLATVGLTGGTYLLGPDGLDLPGASVIGDAELLAAAILTTSVWFAAVSLSRPLVDDAIVGVQVELSAALLERGLDPPRPRLSIAARTASLVVSVGIAMFLGVAGMAAHWRVEGLREAAMTEARSLVQLEALRLEHGDAGSDPRVTIVAATDGLPPPLGLIDAASDHVVVASYDPRAQRAVATAWLDERQLIQASVALDEQLRGLAILITVIVLLVCVVTWISAHALGRAIESPLEHFVEAAQRFAERGELQALGRLVPLRNDHLGQVARHFNAMLDALEQLAHAAEAVARGDLTTTLERPGELHDAFRGMIARLRETVAQLHETAGTLGQATAELDALIKHQEQTASEQAEGATAAARSVTALASTAQDIASTARGVLGDVEQVVESTGWTTEQVAILNEKTAAIAELLAGIRGVADRSDLLALNGSLEATRAGEAGRGFAIVAQEMRRLAERVGALVDGVETQLGFMHHASAHVVMATQESDRVSQRTAEAVRAISDLTTRQSEETDEAAGGIEEVAVKVAATAEASSRTRVAVEALRAQTEVLERLAAQFEI